MGNKCKRFLSLLLALTMVIGMIPFGHAHAEVHVDGNTISMNVGDTHTITVDGDHSGLTGNDAVSVGAVFTPQMTGYTVATATTDETLETGKYVLMNTRVSKFLEGTADSGKLWLNGKIVTGAEIWTITAVEGGYTMKASNGQYMTFDGSSSGLTDTETVLSFTWKEGTSTWQIGLSGQYLNSYDNEQKVAGWYQDGDTGSQWKLYRVTDQPAYTWTLGDSAGEIKDGGYYIFENNVAAASREATLASSTWSNTDNGGGGSGYGLLMDGNKTSFGEQHIWQITGTAGSYHVQALRGWNLYIASGKATLTAESHDTVVGRDSSSHADTWQISVGGVHMNYWGGAYQSGDQIAGWSDVNDTNNQWNIYEVIPTAAGTTTVTFTALSAGDAEITIGDAIYTVHVTDAHVHHYTGEVTTAATCTTPGVMTYTCTCGEGTYTEEIPATGHGNTTTTGAVKPTLCQPGQTGTTVCADCGETIGADTQIGELPVATVLNGDKLVALNDCEYTFGGNSFTHTDADGTTYYVKPAAGNSSTEGTGRTSQLPQTTTKFTGITLDWENSTIDGTVWINGNGSMHVWTNADKPYWDKCGSGHGWNSSNGTHDLYLFRATGYGTGDVIPGYTQVTSAEGMVIGGNYLIAAKKGDDAWYVMHPSGSSHAWDHIALVSSELRPVAHVHGEAVTENLVNATCTTEGSYDSVTYCTICGVELSRTSVTIPATEHTPGEAATCTSAQTCTVCNTELAPATGHAWDNDCDTECANCGETREAAHNYSAVVTAPTCTEDGYTTYTCGLCGDSYTADTVTALGHDVNGEGQCTNCGLYFVYFINSAGWGNVNAYLWTDGSQSNASWPGEAMTSTGESVHGYDVFVITSETKYANIIFNDNSSAQTADRTAEYGKYYDYYTGTWYDSFDGEHVWTAATCTAPKTCFCGETEGNALDHAVNSDGQCTNCGLYFVYFINSAEWSNVYAYQWTGEQYKTAWPGEAMTPTSDSVNGYAVFVVTTETKYANIIFNNGTGTQTADLTAEYGKYYDLSTATWYNSPEDVLPPHVHTWGVPAFRWATDYGTCTVVFTCGTCNETISGTAAVTSETTEASCTKEGKIIYTATYGQNSTYTDVVEVTLPATGHTEGEAVTENEVDATCTEEGSYDTVTYCSVCDAEVTRETTTVSAKGHTEAEAVIESEVAATCTEDGSYESVVYCSVCDEEVSRETTTVPATGHTEAEAVVENEVAATCTEEGSYDTVVYCSVCDAEVTRETITVSAKGHTEAEAVTENEVAATCTEEGSYDTVTYCSVCHAELSRETVTVPTTGHTPGEAVVENNVEPTLNSEGFYDTVVYCSVCDEELSRETTVVPELTGAVAQIGEIKYATFAEALDAAQEGDTIVLLNEDGIEITADTTYDLTGITVESEGDVFVVTGGTLTLNGSGTVKGGTSGVGSWTAIWANGGHVVINGGTYSVGGDSTATDTTHQNDVIYTKNGGTVIINGGTFLNDGTVWTLNENDANRGTITVYGGTFQNWNPADNNSEGVHTSFLAEGYCAAEEDNVYTVQTHDYEGVVTDPTCTEKGYTTYTCVHCGDTYTADEVDAKGHTESEAVVENEVAATCTEEGSYDTVIYCSVCDAELSRETITVSAKGHTEAEAVTENIVDATCTEDGSYDTVIYCSVCDAEVSRETTTVSAKGHTEAEAVTENEVAATCTEDGSYESVVYCSVCDAEVSRETVTVPAKGHTEAEAVTENEVAATCTEEGSYESVVYCSVCNEVVTRETVTVPATGHTYETVVTAPTCTEDGYTTYTCACGDSYVSDETPALGHDFENGTCTVCGSGIAVNTATGETYADLADALAAAKAGDTVKLLGDTEAGNVLVYPDVTLDLNGCELTADHVVGFTDARIVDNAGGGRLIVEKRNIVLDEKNPMIPLYDGTGYIFTTVGFAISQDDKFEGPGIKIKALVCPQDMAAVELLKKGAAATNIQIIIRLSWDAADGTGSQEFLFKDEVVQAVYNSNKGDIKVGSYDQMFTMVVTGIENVENLRANIVIVSDTNVERTPDSITIN